MNPQALHKISYGMYILTSGKDNKFNGQIVNAVIQATSDPATVTVCVNHDNLTHEMIEDSKVFTLSILSENTPMNLIGNFGYKSGRDIDKFEGINCKTGQNGVPIVLDSVTAFLEFELINQMDMGSHTMFAGRVINGDILSDDNPMTYEYYHNVKGGKSPKSAPHYIEGEEDTVIKTKGDGKMNNESGACRRSRSAGRARLWVTPRRDSIFLREYWSIGVLARPGATYRVITCVQLSFKMKRIH